MSSIKKHLRSKLVYIHELDSARNSEAEIEHARERLYEEIVVNGNTPVISFNQLADSKAFLGLVTESANRNAGTENALYAESENSDLTDIGYLMQRGRIKIARFSDKRTASQYLQDNLSPDKTKGQSRFVLSGWPIPEHIAENDRVKIYERIRIALRNSDPDYIDTPSGKSSTNGQEPANLLSDPDKECIKQIKQLIIFMLSISKTKFAYADINKGPKPELSKLIGHIITALDDEQSEMRKNIHGISPKDILDSCIQLKMAQVKVGESANSRSAWYNALRPQTPAKEPLSSERTLAHQIIDLSYNITVESGIDKCSLLFDPSSKALFEKAVGRMLSHYNNDYEAHGHAHASAYSVQPDHVNSSAANKNYRTDNAPKRDWGLLVNIQNALDRKFKGSSFSNDELATYGSSIRQQRTVWRRNVYKSLVFQTLGAILYVILFGFIEVVLSLIDGLMEGAFTSVVAAEALGVEDLLTFDRAAIITVVFAVGVIAYAVMTRGNKYRSAKIPMIGIAVFFFILFPLITCVELVPSTQGTFSVSFNPADFFVNFFLVLPNMLVGFIGVLAFAIIGSLLEDRTGLPGLFDSMKLAKDSFVDSLKFLLVTHKFARGKESGILAEFEEEDEVTGKLNAHVWEGFLSSWEDVSAASSDTSQPKASTSTAAFENNPVGAWDSYVSLVHQQDKGHEYDQELKIVLDDKQVDEYENESGNEIGIVYDSPYNTLVVDLVENQQGGKFAYERLIPKNEGAVVIVPCYEGRFIMLNQYRHAIRGHQVCFPRGFGEKALAAEENARTELREEIGADSIGPMRKLGDLTPDSGVSSNTVSVFICNVGDYDPAMRDEGIAEIIEVTPSELSRLVKEQEITDGFTLAALAMLQADLS